MQIVDVKVKNPANSKTTIVGTVDSMLATKKPRKTTQQKKNMPNCKQDYDEWVERW